MKPLVAFATMLILCAISALAQDNAQPAPSTGVGEAPSPGEAAARSTDGGQAPTLGEAAEEQLRKLREWVDANPEAGAGAEADALPAPVQLVFLVHGQPQPPVRTVTANGEFAARLHRTVQDASQGARGETVFVLEAYGRVRVVTGSDPAVYLVTCEGSVVARDEHEGGAREDAGPSGQVPSLRGQHVEFEAGGFFEPGVEQPLVEWEGGALALTIVPFERPAR